MELGKRIIELRRKKKMTQEDLAELFDVSRQTISNWENGKSYPDITLLLKISKEFNISLDELMREDKKIINTIVKNEKQKRKYMIASLILIFIIILILIFQVYFHKNSNNPSFIAKVNYDYIEAEESKTCNKKPILYYQDNIRKVYLWCIDKISIVEDDKTSELKQFIKDNNLTIDWLTSLFMEKEIYDGRHKLYSEININRGWFSLRYKLSKDNIKIIECNNSDNNNIYIGNKDIQYDKSLCNK